MAETLRRAKIVCTIGPASASRAVLRRLILAGMNVARLNFSHGTHDQHRETYNLLRDLSEETGRPVGILQDLQGPKLRLGDLGPNPITLIKGETVVLTTDLRSHKPGRLPVTHKRLTEDVATGESVLINDGLVRLVVKRVVGKEVHCTVAEGGEVSSRKGINLPGAHVSTPSMTAKDRRDLEFGIELGVDFVALSFVRSAKDVRAVRKVLNQHGSSIAVVAKLEKPQAVDNLEEIIDEADAIMVARGDLGVELPPEFVPVLQKRMIRFARAAGKPVITATQMLESMVEHSKPTRAEASDVANAVYDGSDALMLSAETAAGKYPVQSVAMMDRIIRSAEASRSYSWGAPNAEIAVTLADAVGVAAAETAQHLGARAITVFTQTGGSARVVSKYRPRVPIFGYTPIPAVHHRLTLVWGVEPKLVEPLPTTDDMVDRVAALLCQERRIKRGDLIVVTAGTPVHQPGTTNFIKFHRVV